MGLTCSVRPVCCAALAALPKNITVKITGFENAGMMMAPNPPCMTQVCLHRAACLLNPN